MPRRRVIHMEVVNGQYSAFCDDGTHWLYHHVYGEWVNEGPPSIPQSEEASSNYGLLEEEE